MNVHYAPEGMRLAQARGRVNMRRRRRAPSRNRISCRSCRARRATPKGAQWRRRRHRRFTAGTCSPQRPVSSRRIASLPRESIRPTLDRHTEHSRTIIAMTAATTNKPIHVSLIPDSLTGLPNNLLISRPRMGHLDHTYSR